METRLFSTIVAFSATIAGFSLACSSGTPAAPVVNDDAGPNPGNLTADATTGDQDAEVTPDANSPDTSDRFDGSSFDAAEDARDGDGEADADAETWGVDASDAGRDDASDAATDAPNPCVFNVDSGYCYWNPEVPVVAPLGCDPNPVREDAGDAGDAATDAATDTALCVVIDAGWHPTK